MAGDREQAGTPQGAVLLPLLANLYLYPLDLLMEQSGYRIVRYADDFVFLCAAEAEVAAALRQVAAWVDANGLVLQLDKTGIGDSGQPGQGFDFLGFGSRVDAASSAPVPKAGRLRPATGLRAILRKQEKRPSMGRSEAEHRRWTNAFFADGGLFTMPTAYAAARHSR